MPAGHFDEEQFDVRSLGVVDAQRTPNLPMPVGQDTVADAVPGSHDEPAYGGHRKASQVETSGTFRNPSEHVEHDEDRVERKEQPIQQQ